MSANGGYIHVPLKPAHSVIWFDLFQDDRWLEGISYLYQGREQGVYYLSEIHWKSLYWQPLNVNGSAVNSPG